MARRLIAALGGPPDAPIGRDPAGCPVWPAGFAGSISHTSGFTAVLVARTAGAVGIDLERVGRIDAALWPSVFTPVEMLSLRTQREHALAATVLFSAKEAVQKAAYARGGAWAELSRISLVVDWRRRRFRSPQLHGGIGHFVCDGEHVLTACSIQPVEP